MYVKNITIHTTKDWSKVSDQDIWAKIGFKDPERNFGLHNYKNDLNENNLENKILKFAIIKCKNILKRKRFFSFDVEKKLLFITKALLNVDLYKPDTKDFNTIQASGLYSHYKPVLNQAKTIIEQKFFSIIQNNESAKKREFCLLPYIINAEALFEFYARAIIKLALKDTDFYVENYSERLFLQDRISKKGESEENIHLMEYCVPDIIIKRKADNRVMMVLDAKYKNSFIPNRDDTHQLLSYVLLTGAQKCGFIFPNSANPSNTEIKSFGEKKDYLTLRPGNIFYNEILLGNNVKNLDSIILEILNKA